MRELERRVQRDFDRIADHAPRSSEASHSLAWDQLRQRLDAQPERIDEEVIMLAPAEPPSRRPRWTTAVAVAVAAVAALVVAGVVVLRSGDDTSTVVDAPVTTLDPEPETDPVTDPEPSTDVDDPTDGPVDGPTEWQYGASLPGELRQVVTWSEGLAAILDADGGENGMSGEVWYSSDGVEWTHQLDPFGPDDDVYLLAGQNGDLFALSGDPDDPTSTRTLWHRPAAGEPWAELITSEALDRMAVGPERLIAYGVDGFEIVGVFDTATLAPVEFTGVPALDVEPGATGGESDEPFEPQLTSGNAVALDEGFLADVQWITGVDDGESVRERRLMYSADGSAWIEHPDPPDGIIHLPYLEPTPVFDGLNLLSLPNQTDTRPVITDDGLSFSAATDPGRGGPTGTDVGFFSVDGGNRIHHSVDGVVWSELSAPPTWPKPPLGANDDAEVQYGSVHTLGDRLLAFGIRGDFAGFVGVVDPTTEIWVVDGWEPSGPEVFSFARHDLCQWVPNDVVAAWVAATSSGNTTVTATTFEPTADAPGCEWTLVTADSGVVTVGVRDASSWQDFAGDPYDFEARIAQDGVTGYDGGSVEIGAWVTGHPALSDGVVVHNGGFGQFAFGVPPGPWLQVEVSPLDWDQGVASEESETRFFALADHFLQTLGWAS